MLAAPAYPTQPTYRGFVSDGWYRDSQGRFLYAPNPQDALTQARAQLTALLADLPAVPTVVALAFAGRTPTPDQLATVTAELNKAPQAVIRDWLARGGRAEVVAGRDAGIHPSVPWKCGGCCIGPLLVVAGEYARHATLHEMGHSHDNVKFRGGRFSSLPEWKAIHAALPPSVFAYDECNGDSHYRSDPSESFAECFGKVYTGPLNRAEVPDVAQQFIRWTVDQV